MAVTIQKLNEVISEAERFLERARAAKSLLEKDYLAEYGSKETGAVRRSSMDLTWALVGVRR